MKHLVSILGSLLLVISCNNTTKTKQYSFDKVGWKIDVPTDLTIMDSAQIAALNQKGADAIGKTYDTSIDFSQTESLISIQKDKMNIISATVTPYDTKKDGEWSETNANLQVMLSETFKSQMPDCRLDTSSGVELINGLSFQVFKTKITYPNKMVLNSMLYSKFYKGYDFGINLTYTDEKNGKLLKDILATSKFTQ